MSHAKHKNLLRNMARIRSLVPKDEQIPEYTDIDWSAPRHFGIETKEQLTELGTLLSVSIKEPLSAICGNEFEVKLNGITEYFANSLTGQFDQQDAIFYCVQIESADRRQAGFISLPLESCVALIRQVLCDPEAQIGQEGRLSSLERSILQDNLFLVANSLISAVSECGSLNLSKGQELVHSKWPVSFTELEEMCHFSYTASRESVQLELSLYLLDDVADSMIGIRRDPISQEELSEFPATIIERVKDIDVEVSAGFNASMMTLQSILTLEKDDVVLLNHHVSTPVNVIVNKQIGFTAWPAKSTDHLAVVVAEKAVESNR